MEDATVLDIALQAIIVTAKLSAPILLVTLALGFAISLFQSVTQIQEATLSFVPKLVGVALVLLFAGNWMLHEMISFTEALFEMVPELVDRR